MKEKLEQIEKDLKSLKEEIEGLRFYILEQNNPSRPEHF